MQFLSKHFPENWEEIEIYPFPIDSWFFFTPQLEKCQNEHYPDNLNLIHFCSLTSLKLVMFPISVRKRNLWSFWKWLTSEEKIWGYFMTSRKEIYFSYNKFLSYICWQGDFFHKYIEMGLKILFIIFEGFFEWQK